MLIDFVYKRQIHIISNEFKFNIYMVAYECNCIVVLCIYRGIIAFIT